MEVGVWEFVTRCWWILGEATLAAVPILGDADCTLKCGEAVLPWTILGEAVRAVACWYCCLGRATARCGSKLSGLC